MTSSANGAGGVNDPEAKVPFPSRLQSAFALAGWLALCFGAASLGAAFLPGERYAALQKPSWNPPGWIFAPVWTALYTMMAVAAWRVWRGGGFARRWLELRLFLLQLFFNVLWSWLFFGLQNPALALLDIVSLWLALLATLIVFWRASAIAGLLLAPYLAWVSFAMALNFALWRLNR